MTDTYVTPTDLLNSGEDVQDIVAESKDYVPYELLEPTHGDVKYVSQSREVLVNRKVSAKGQPFLSIELRVSELVGPDGTKIELSRPLRTWINTLQFAQRNRPGTTSSASDYLQEAGFSPKELGGEAILEALQESAQIPMECVIAWTNQTKKTGEKDANGKDKYTEEFAKTRDFNVGTPDDPKYVAEFTSPSGEVVRARHRVAAFRRL